MITRMYGLMEGGKEEGEVGQYWPDRWIKGWIYVTNPPYFCISTVMFPRFPFSLLFANGFHRISDIFCKYNFKFYNYTALAMYTATKLRDGQSQFILFLCDKQKTQTQVLIHCKLRFFLNILHHQSKNSSHAYMHT